MRKVIYLFLIPATIFLTGCFDYSAKINVNQDGSGVVEEKVLFSNMMVDMMKSFSSGFSDSAQTKQDSFQIFDENELIAQAKKMGEGVKYIGGKKITEAGMQGYVANFEFEDITKVHISQNPSDKFSEDESVSSDIMKDDKDMQFAFSEGDPSKLTVIIPRDSTEEKKTTDEQADTASSESAWGDQTRMFLRGLRIAILLEPQGKIIETNASYVEDNQITLFEMDFDKLLNSPDKYEEFKNANPESVEEISKIVEGIPGFKFELKKEVFVKFD